MICEGGLRPSAANKLALHSIQALTQGDMLKASADLLGIYLCMREPSRTQSWEGPLAPGGLTRLCPEICTALMTWPHSTAASAFKFFMLLPHSGSSEARAREAFASAQASGSAIGAVLENKGVKDGLTAAKVDCI